MAKKQNPLGSLVPVTDTNLVNQAYRMAMANVPKDLSSIHNRMAASYAAGADALGKGIAEVFKTAGQIYAKVKEESDQEETDTKASREFKNGKIAVDTDYSKVQGYEPDGDVYYRFDDEATTDVDEGDVILRSEIETPITYNSVDYNGNSETISVMNFDEHQKHLKALKKKVRSNKNLSFNEKRRKLKKLSDREDMARESSILFLKTEAEIDDLIKNGDLSENATNVQKIQFLRAIKNNGKLVDDGNGNKTRALMGFNQEGEIVFSYVDEEGRPIKDKSGNPITVRPGEAKSLVTPKDSEMRNKINTIQDEYIKLGSEGNQFDDAYNSRQGTAITAAISSKKKFNDFLGFKPEGFGQNFEQAVNGIGDENTEGIELSNLPEQLFNSLPKDFVPDNDNSGDVSAGDFQTTENYKKLRDAILNTEDKNFDLSRSALVAKEFLISKFKVDSAGALKIYTDDPANAAAIAKKKREQQVRPEVVLTQEQQELQGIIANLEKTEGGRKALNQIGTFTEIIQAGGEGQQIIDLNLDSGGNIIKNIKVDSKAGKITTTNVDKGTGNTVTKEVTLREAVTLISNNSGLSVNKVIDLMGLKDGRNIVTTMFEKSGADKGYGFIGAPEGGRGEDAALVLFQDKYKDIKDLNVSVKSDGKDKLFFNYPGARAFEYDPMLTGDKYNTQLNGLKAWFQTYQIKSK